VTAVEDIIDSVADALDNVDEKPTDRQLWDLESVLTKAATDLRTYLRSRR